MSYSVSLQTSIQNGVEPERLLCFRSRDGDMDAVRILLESGIDANTRSGMALALAATPEIAKLLLENGARVTREVMYMGIRQGNAKTVRMLREEHNGPLHADDVVLAVKYSKSTMDRAMVEWLAAEDICKGHLSTALKESLYRKFDDISIMLAAKIGDKCIEDCLIQKAAKIPPPLASYPSVMPM